MAKLTALQIVNKILSNLGDSQVTTLASITGAALFAFNAANEAIYEIAWEYPFQQNEFAASMTVVTGTATFTKSSGLYMYDKESFRYDEKFAMDFYTQSKFNREYPSQTSTNVPKIIRDTKNLFWIYPIPPASESGKIIKYDAWSIPTILSTATDTGTCWIPEGFDLTLLCDWATKKVLHYRHNEEESIYGVKIWGEERADGRGNQGNMSRFINLYGSHMLETKGIMVEPMEGTRSQNLFVQQSPITG